MDGIVSTASLIIGGLLRRVLRIAVFFLPELLELVAGSMSMAAGEYVSVSSQSDTENADLELERQSLEQNYQLEKDELAENIRR